MKINRDKVYVADYEEGEQAMVNQFVDYVKSLENTDAYATVYQISMATPKYTAKEFIGVFNSFVKKHGVNS